MAFEQRELSGSLFKNDKKTAESQPNARGEARIAGVTYYVSAWTKQDKNGNKWQSLSFTAKDAAEKPKPRGPSGFDDLQDDVPF